MRRPLATFALLFAWLCANGAVWDAMQLVAWSKMFVGYSHDMNVSAALRETFDPSKACEMCRVITKAKETAKKDTPAPEQSSAAKFVLAIDVPEPPVFANDRGDWAVSVARRALSRTDPVPLPPPRA